MYLKSIYTQNITLTKLLPIVSVSFEVSTSDELFINSFCKLSISIFFKSLTSVQSSCFDSLSDFSTSLLLFTLLSFNLETLDTSDVSSRTLFISLFHINW